MCAKENIYSTVKVGKRIHVVKSIDRGYCKDEKTGEPIPDPDYMGTGKALCGILEEGQTLEEFINSLPK